MVQSKQVLLKVNIRTYLKEMSCESGQGPGEKRNTEGNSKYKDLETRQTRLGQKKARRPVLLS